MLFMVWICAIITCVYHGIYTHTYQEKELINLTPILQWYLISYIKEGIIFISKNFQDKLTEKEKSL